MTELKSKISDYSVCVVTASAGFGKTTLLSQVVQDLNLPVCWYTPGPEDDSVYIFLAYLVSALEMLIPGISEWYFERIGEQKFAWQRAFEILLSGIEELDNSEGILVIDDWQLVERDQEVVEFFDRFLCCKPEGLRVVLISREV
ncbi:MAG: AAA family ATPase, partial [Tenuifilaceae bacterium]